MLTQWLRKRQDTVNGYVREATHYDTCRLLPISDIARIISTFYTPNIRTGFHPDKHSKTVKVIDNHTIETMDEEYTCLIAESIDKSLCNVFTIEFTLKSIGERALGSFAALFIIFSDWKMEEIDKISNWESVSTSLRKMHKFSTLITMDCQSEISTTDDWNPSKLIEDKSTTIDSDDKFKYRFDFEDKRFVFWLNDEEIYSNQLPCDRIIGSIAGLSSGQIIQITKFELE